MGGLPGGVQWQLPPCQIRHGSQPHWTMPRGCGCSELFTAMPPPLPPAATKVGSAPQHGGHGTLFPASPGVPRQVAATGGASGCSVPSSPRSVVISNAWTPAAPGQPLHPTVLRVTPAPPGTRGFKCGQSRAALPRGLPAMPRPCGVMQEKHPQRSPDGRPPLLSRMAPAEGHGHCPPLLHAFLGWPLPSPASHPLPEALNGHGDEEPGGVRTPSPPGWVGSPPGPCHTPPRGLRRCRACPRRAWGGAGGVPPAPLCSSAPGGLAGANALFTPTQLLKTPRP